MVRPISLSTVAASVLLALTGLEIGVRELYEPPAPMLRKAVQYQQAAHEGRELLILGTCLPEQILKPELLAKQIGPDVRVHILATPAAGAQLFTLVLRNYVPDNAKIAAIVVPYGRRDLTNEMPPWESQVMELASWGDVPGLIGETCDDAGCAAEILLRKASRAYRYRGWLANRFWFGVGSKPPIPGFILSPGAVDPNEGADGVVHNPGAPPPGPPQGTPGAMPPPGGFGWERPDDGLAEEDPSRFVHLEAMLAEAKKRDLRVLFTPLPERAAGGGRPPPNSAYDRRVAEVIREGGGELLELSKIDGLGPQHFEDDVHLNAAGQQLVTLAIGAALARQLEQ